MYMHLSFCSPSGAGVRSKICLTVCPEKMEIKVRNSSSFFTSSALFNLVVFNNSGYRAQNAKSGGGR